MEIKEWKLPPADQAPALALARETGYPEILCRVLYNRGFCAKDQVDGLFHGEGRLDNPFLLADMDKAVRRVRGALEEGERIAVYGDYDCDGITATALLVSYLQSVGADVFYYIPDRDKEGYGLSREAVDALAGYGAKLILTVDNGVASHEEIAYASELGMDTVVTDHHIPRDTLPQAAAVVNPHRTDCPSAFKSLAGVGVAFKLVCALEEADGEELLEHYSDLVMLGTIADVMQLTGENRLIAVHGLQRLAHSERPGLPALMELSGIAPEAVTSEAVAYGIIPRLNAAGRMGSADDAVELLLTDDVPYAWEMARRVNDQNVSRKEAEMVILAEIEGILKENPQILREPVILVAGEGWRHGVMGIVAAKVTETHGKPAILFSCENGIARGSGRSVEGFPLIEAVSACARHLTRYGGHPLAAGLTLPCENLAAFTEDLLAWAREKYPVTPLPRITVDCVLSPGSLTVEAVDCLSLLEPFGAGNRPPLFLLPDLTVGGVYPTADKKHIRLRLSGEGHSFYAVYFRMPQGRFPYRAGDKVDVVAALSAGEYQGKRQLSVRVRDLRAAGIPQEAILAQRERYLRYLGGGRDDADCRELLPDRRDLACVYRYLLRGGGYPYGDMELYYRVRFSGMAYDRMRVTLDVMEELGLIDRTGRGGEIAVIAAPGDPKVNMDTSRILMALKR